MSLTDWDGLNRWARELKSLPCPEDGLDGFIDELRQHGAQVAAEDLYRFLLWGRFPRPRFSNDVALATAEERLIKKISADSDMSLN